MHKANKGIITFFFSLSVLLLSPHIHADEPLNYSFKKGDTLFSIAQKYNTSVIDLQTYNRIKDPKKIIVGTVIKIPPATDNQSKNDSTINYTIKQGDTLSYIAKHFSVPLEVLLKLNHLTKTSILIPNRQLKIPVTETTQTSAGKQNVPDVKQTNHADSAAGDPFFWPHPGSVHPLSGKLNSTVEIKGQPGDEVLAVSSGRVMWAGLFRGYGQMVFIQSPAGYVFAYGGQAKLLVKPGEKVTKGQTIGSLGKNPKDGEAKVFFCVTYNSKPVDPFAAPR